MPTHAPIALPRSSPESEGVPSHAVLSFVDAIESKGLELHSLMLLRHDQVFAEGWWRPFSADRRHLLYSLSKSFTSTGIGMLIDEGKLSLDDRVVSFFPDETPADTSENLRNMRVRDLLTMTAGHDADDLSDLFGREDGDWARGFLARAVPYEPGTHFLYNTSATYMCSAILSRIAGESLFTYLTPRLFEPLGIEGARWSTCPKGVTYGGSGLEVRTEDIAKFGTLYLRKGVYGGKRLVSEHWISQATIKQVPNGDDPNSDWNQGYGFQFWRSRHNCYRGDGAFGQFCFVIPETDMVIAITSSVDDMGAVMQAVWDHLRYAPTSATLAEDPTALEHLRSRLSALEVAGPSGEPNSPTATRVSGRWFKNDQASAEADTVRFEFAPNGGCIVTFKGSDGQRTVAVGGDRWDVHTGPKHDAVVAMRGAWTSPDVYTIATRCIQGPETRTFTCHFEGDRVSCRETKRGYFGPTEGRKFDGALVSS